MVRGCVHRTSMVIRYCYTRAVRLKDSATVFRCCFVYGDLCQPDIWLTTVARNTLTRLLSIAHYTQHCIPRAIDHRLVSQEPKTECAPQLCFKASYKLITGRILSFHDARRHQGWNVIGRIALSGGRIDVSKFVQRDPSCFRAFVPLSNNASHHNTA